MRENDHEYIDQKLIPEVIERMRESRLQYGDAHQTLGPAGQFADIWRKVGPLKLALWEGKTLPREGPREICMDLIGHCLLTIAMLDDEGNYVERPS